MNVTTEGGAPGPFGSTSNNPIIRNHLALVVWSESERFGTGNRIVYLKKCDGKTCVAINCLGYKYRIPVSQLIIKEVLHHDFKLDEETGFLLVRPKVKDAEFIAICSWLFPERKKAKQAKDGRNGGRCKTNDVGSSRRGATDKKGVDALVERPVRARRQREGGKVVSLIKPQRKVVSSSRKKSEPADDGLGVL